MAAAAATDDNPNVQAYKRTVEKIRRETMQRIDDECSTERLRRKADALRTRSVRSATNGNGRHMLPTDIFEP